MTFATSHSDSWIHRRGFTLTEILVVIGIILVLVGILVPTIIRTYGTADKTRFAFNLQVIGTGLEAYKQDFGDYPRNLNAATGAAPAVLCKALVGPGNATTDSSPAYSGAATAMPGDLVKSGGSTYVATQPAPASSVPPDAQYWAVWSPLDGADGPGFKVRAGGGKTWGPYLQLDRFKINGQFLLDKNGAAILYYPANPVKSVVTSGTNYVGTTATSLYNSNDCMYGAVSGVTSAVSANNLRGLLGNYSLTGAINSTYGTEQAIGNYPYLLISAGPDGAFGPLTDLVAVNSATLWRTNKSYIAGCDDITNFPR